MSKKRTIYLSGGIQGRTKEEAYAEFEKYENMYLKLGWKVYNPMKMDGGEHGDIDGAGVIRPTERQWRAFIARDLALILRADIDRLYMLPGWTSSRGARLEALVANYVGIPHYNAETGGRIAAKKVGA